MDGHVRKVADFLSALSPVDTPFLYGLREGRFGPPIVGWEPASHPRLARLAGTVEQQLGRLETWWGGTLGDEGNEGAAHRLLGPVRHLRWGLESRAQRWGKRPIFDPTWTPRPFVWGESDPVTEEGGREHVQGGP